MLHSQKRATWKTWIFLELNSATAEGGHSFSGLFKNSHSMDTHYFVHTSHLRIHTSHRHTPQNVCMHLPISKGHCMYYLRHLPLEEQVDQHYSSCDHVYLCDSPGTQITNSLRQALPSLFTGKETKAQ